MVVVNEWLLLLMAVGVVFAWYSLMSGSGNLLVRYATSAVDARVEWGHGIAHVPQTSAVAVCASQCPSSTGVLSW